MSRGILGLAFFATAFVALVLLFRVEDGGGPSAVSKADAGRAEREAARALVITPAMATAEITAQDRAGAAADPPAELFVTAAALNIRAAPETAGRVVARAGKGDAVRVLEVRDGWARLSSDGGEPRWAAAAFLSRERPAVERYVTASELNVRAAPGHAGPVIDRIGYRTRVVVYELEDGWARLTPDDAAPRFVAAKYLARERPPARYTVMANGLNIRAAPRTGKVVDRAERGETLAIYAVSDGWGRLTQATENARWAAMEHLSETP